MQKIALVTAQPGFGIDVDTDLPVLSAAISEHAGLDATVIAWDDPAADWAAFDLAVIRSTWDYAGRLAEFLTWVDRCAAATRLVNPAALVRWNIDKRYLGELADRGVPVIPTSYLPPGEPVEVAAVPAGGDVVVKPAVGAGARRAARYRAGEGEAARTHIQQLHADGVTAMVQPYVSGVDTTGERALVFIGGELLHAIRKGPVLTPGTRPDAPRSAHPDRRIWSATAAEVAVARRALAAVPVPEEPLYARVDLIDDERGEPMLIELELVEPYLFLTAHPESVPVVAGAIAAAAGADRSA